MSPETRSFLRQSQWVLIPGTDERPQAQWEKGDCVMLKEVVSGRDGPSDQEIVLRLPGSSTNLLIFCGTTHLIRGARLPGPFLAGSSPCLSVVSQPTCPLSTGKQQRQVCPNLRSIFCGMRFEGQLPGASPTTTCLRSLPAAQILQNVDFEMMFVQKYTFISQCKKNLDTNVFSGLQKS